MSGVQVAPDEFHLKLPHFRLVAVPKANYGNDGDS
jgi:hypothetical protein